MGIPSVKLAIYAIVKDEEAHVGRFLDTCREADGIFVLDTGSRDGTVKALQKAGIAVSTRLIRPWRFDAARNAAMALVPLDYRILWALDFDEQPRPGWRKAILDAWDGSCNQLVHTEVFCHNADGSPTAILRKEKIHNRDFRWVHPTHECLEPRKGKKSSKHFCQVIVDHWQDRQKQRPTDLPLLELGVKERPHDARMAYYHGRELWYVGKYADAVAELGRYLCLPGARWNAERAAALRHMANCYLALRDYGQAEACLLRSCGEHPSHRDAWLEMARFYLDRQNYAGAYFAAHRALAIKERRTEYFEDEASWRERPYDILSVAAWYMGKKDEAKAAVNIAIYMAPHDARILKNHAMMEGIAATGGGTST